VIWKTNRDEALELHHDGKCVGGIWRSAWKTGKRHVPKKEVVNALAVASVITGMSLPIGPHDILQHGFLAAIWHPYERVGHFETVREAKQAVEERLQNVR